jgi:hypothetical protein
LEAMVGEAAIPTPYSRRERATKYISESGFSGL